MEENIENLNDGYKYSGDGEVMSDISSTEPVNVVKKKKKKVVQVEEIDEVTKNEVVEEIIEPVQEPVQEPIEVPVVRELSQKEMFTDMINEDRHFTIKVGGTLIFDSEVNNRLTVIFEETYFIVGKQQYSYDSLNFKFKK